MLAEGVSASNSAIAPFRPFSCPSALGLQLHPEPRHGTLFVLEKSPSAAWSKIGKEADLVSALIPRSGRHDVYLTVNEFGGWIKEGLLLRLKACYVDLDDCSSVEAALLAVDEAVLPTPSVAVHSGKGVHLYWLIEPATSRALPVWKCIQAHLVTALKSVGADPSAKCCTRVLRLPGTINSKVNKSAIGYVISNARWTLHELADEVIGHRPTANHRPGAESRKRQKVFRATAHLRLWYGRARDLYTVAAHYADHGGVPEGSRDKLLFLLATALSWLVESDALMDEIHDVARRFTPTLSDEEVRSYMSTVVSRAKDAAAGDTIEFDGRPVDPRYRMTTDSIRKWLGPLLTPALEKKLNVLLPEDQLLEREAQRQKGRDRVREGRYRQDRSAYLEAHGLERNQPWVALGISRRTYFRRKKNDASGPLAEAKGPENRRRNGWH